MDFESGKHGSRVPARSTGGRHARILADHQTRGGMRSVVPPQGARMTSENQSVLHLLPDAIPELVDLYRDLPAHPELSEQQQRPAGAAAARLEQAGFDVTTRVGGT